VKDEVAPPSPASISHRLGGTQGSYVHRRRRSPPVTLTVKASRELVARLDAAVAFAKTNAPALGVNRSQIVTAALQRHLAALEKLELKVLIGGIPTTEEQE
jgi:hypothetical protein